jgi:adenylate cyclase
MSQVKFSQEDSFKITGFVINKIMRLQFKKDRYLTFFFSFLAVLLLTLFVCLIFLLNISSRKSRSEKQRYESYLLADELRQSSDDLTKMVRLYVVTGEQKYRDYFNEILAIRNGELPRPLEYHLIYWDLVQNSKRPREGVNRKALKQLMIEQGFTLQEFDLLQKAQNLSDDLTDIEFTAMNAMEGKFDDGTGNFSVQGPPDPELAKKLVFSDLYMDEKRKIMTPILEFFRQVESRTQMKSEQLANETRWVISLAILLSGCSTIVMVFSIVKAIRMITKASRDTDMLLLNILPSPIAERLKGGEEHIADEFPQVSVFFADIVKFTELAAKIGSSNTVKILSDLFDEIDDLTGKFGVEKIKTIGDNYMAVSGLPIPKTDHAIKMAEFALTVRDMLKGFNEKNKLEIEMRYGMTFGSVVAGVIGHKKFIYDLWGDVVNTASRMESSGVPGEIQITEKMALLLEEKFILQERGEPIEIKGKGKMKTFFLKGKKG